METLRSALQTRRLRREKKTLAVMVRLYCSNHHHTAAGLCGPCRALLAYAQERVDRCVFALNKPACTNCPVHCYEPQMREAIRKVMRYSGPRMLTRHPVLALGHLIDERRECDEEALRRAGKSGEAGKQGRTEEVTKGKHRMSNTQRSMLNTSACGPPWALDIEHSTPSVSTSSRRDQFSKGCGAVCWRTW